VKVRGQAYEVERLEDKRMKFKGEMMNIQLMNVTSQKYVETQHRQCLSAQQMNVSYEHYT
jgi:hypothetical protein